MFVEDIKRLDGRHVVVKAVRKSGLRSTAEVYSYGARKTAEFGYRDALLEREYVEILTFVHLQRGKSAVTSISYLHFLIERLATTRDCYCPKYQHKVRHCLSYPDYIAIMPSEPNVHALSQPAKIKDTLAEQQKDYDCTPCRLMGMLLSCPVSAKGLDW